jgi:hypothetical protein
MNRSSFIGTTWSCCEAGPGWGGMSRMAAMAAGSFLISYRQKFNLARSRFPPRGKGPQPPSRAARTQYAIPRPVGDAPKKKDLRMAEVLRQIRHKTGGCRLYVPSLYHRHYWPRRAATPVMAEYYDDRIDLSSAALRCRVKAPGTAPGGTAGKKKPAYHAPALIAPVAVVLSRDRTDGASARESVPAAPSASRSRP